MMERKNQNVFPSFGFSLIEVVVGLGLVLVILLIFGAAVNTIPLTKTARNQNIAYHLAARKIEELRNTNFASLPASGSFSDPGLSQLPASSASLTISDYQGSSLIKHVTVTVSWAEPSSRNVILDTLMSRDGLNQP